MREMATNTQSPSPKLPLDVLLCIVDTLAYLDYIDTLKSFSMVHSIFRPLCASHIFATITTTNDAKEDYSPFNQLKILLEVNPSLINYIKHLDIWFKRSDWDNPKVPFFLNQLRPVNTLLLKSHRVIWDTIPISLRTSLERHICSPSLIHLEVTTISNFPVPWILANSPSLKVLDLSNSVAPSADLNMPPVIVSQHAPVPQLRSFSTNISRSPEIAELLFETKRPDGQPTISMTSVETLCLRLDPTTDDLHMIGKYLGCSTKLQEILLYVSHSAVSMHPPTGLKFVEYVHPSSLKTIKSLDLAFQISTYDHEDPYCGICDELRMLASAKCPLESLELSLALNINGSIEYPIDPDDWNRLEDVLNLPNFPALRRILVTVVLDTMERPSDVPERLRQMAQIAFRTFAREPSIEFCFSVVHLE